MAENPTWDVDLFVDGPVTLRRRFRTRRQKGFRPDNPFYSDIEIFGIHSGVLRATVTARATNKHLAREAAVFFFGRMLDVLAFKIDLPLFLSLTESERSRNAHIREPERRIIEPREIEDAFREATDLTVFEAPFLRGLGWYRKGHYTEDPFDKFLAFWLAIETVATDYYESVPSINKERAKNGQISQTWECFKALWGPYEQWPNIPGDDKWIDKTWKIRNYIAHGARSVDPETVATVVGELDTIQRVARTFLQDWKSKVLDADWGPSSQRLPDSDEEALPF